MFVLETKQVSLIDQYLCNHGYTILELISLAGNAFYQHVKKYQRPLILAGFGNNGADALFVANLFLKDQKQVDIYCYRPHLMNENCKVLSKELKIIDVISDLNQYDIIIDGIFGAGLNREIEDDLKAIFEKINECNVEKISIDIPSGISGDGMIYGSYFHCDKVITFMGLKKLYLIDEYMPYYHQVILEPLGINEDVFIKNQIATLIDEQYAQRNLKHRHYDDYKNKNGVIMHITGSTQYTGAMVLAAGGSIYSGCGILKVASNIENKAVLNVTYPEAVFINRNELAGYLYQDAAYLIGCGLGIMQENEKVLYDILHYNTKPVVIDADGLNILAKHLEWLEEKTCQVVLTPHLGEYKRLDPTGDIHQFVNQYNCIVVLKGPNTKVIGKDRIYINSTGNKAMATGGSGDTLAGVIVSLLGQGYDIYTASNLGIYFHGRAGDELAKLYYQVLPTLLAKQIGIEMKKVEMLNEK